MKKAELDVISVLDYVIKSIFILPTHLELLSLEKNKLHTAGVGGEAQVEKIRIIQFFSVLPQSVVAFESGWFSWLSVVWFSQFLVYGWSKRLPA